MTFVEYKEALKFMFTVNKEGRSYIENNKVTIQNEFINEGLITY
jgi:hypothetical protein